MTHGITAVQQKLTPAPLSVKGNETSQTPSMTDNDNQSIPERRHRCKTDSNNCPLLSSSVKKERDETLFLELALRGYDLSKLRDEETTAEIVRIG